MQPSVRTYTIVWVANRPAPANLFASNDESPRAEVIWVTELARAIDILAVRNVDAVMVSLPLADCSADDLLGSIRRSQPSTPLVIYEPGGDSVSADLQRFNPSRCISQAVSEEHLAEAILEAIRNGGERGSEARVSPAATRHAMVGSSPAIRQVAEIIRLAGPRRCTVLITGETGSGKEIAARAIHAASNRSGRRMVAVNCAALPDNLLEAELFGHTKGAFTGAVSARVGLFEQAHRSTIFLDEIGELPLPLQAKLLRVLQEREIQRIGSSEPTLVDVRVIAASNINLLEAVANRRFREDLYYRLNVVALPIPSLRERASDIPDLAVYFLAKIADHEGGQAKQLSAEALQALARYSWPGNIRQLEHALESAVALSGTRNTLYPGDFDLPEPAHPSGVASLDVPESGIDFEELMMSIERRLLERALAKSGGNKSRAASLLKMKRTTLISKFKALEVCA
ncbi:MAG TPA: sigma 54-interacting transcriptional regulator [Bryobacteraceae bacterium]|nr:sigma 54-interacting transcriptional regulator [Bryobacteraceae bacterium]